MHTHFTFKGPSRQKGLALVILIVVIALAYISYFFSGLSLTEINVQREKDTHKSLKKAKQALIAYAVNYQKTLPTVRGPGYLLCPDTDNDGVGETACNGPATVGRLPWVTLGVGDLRDGASERLWYAVSENFDFTASPVTAGLTRKVINTATRGNITVRDKNNNIIYDGTLFDAAVAVIIAPGTVLTRDDGVVQDRSDATGDPDAAINYLDIDTTSGEDNAGFQHNSLNGFIKGEILNGVGNVIVNDQFVVITYGEIMEQVHKRVAGEMRVTLSGYLTDCPGGYINAMAFDPTKSVLDGFYTSTGDVEGHIPVNNVQWGPPAGAPTECANGLLPAWFEAEHWHKETYYAFANSAPGCGIDCLTDVFTGANNIDALLVFAGREAGLQSRGDLGPAPPASDLVDYFEGENGSDGDSIYDSGQLNDYVFIIAP